MIEDEEGSGASATPTGAFVPDGIEPASGLDQRLQSPSGQRFYIDCEFDGHGGPLISMAIVAENGRDLYIQVLGAADAVLDQWVRENVVPILPLHLSRGTARVRPDSVGMALREFLTGCDNPVIIADSPVDIGRFCAAISTGEDGDWASTSFPRMTFEVHNVDCYPTELPGALQHNAWWDAMALRDRLAVIEARRVETAKLAPSRSDESANSSETPFPL